MESAEVVVIGAGVIGCAIAHRFAKSGHKTILIDRQSPGKEASAAAAGILAVASGLSKRGPMYHLKRASQDLFPSLVEEIELVSGVDVEYRKAGLIALIRNETEEKMYRRLFKLRQEQGHAVQWLSDAELHQLEPALACGFRGAIHFLDDHSLNNGRLSEAWALTAERSGVIVKYNTTVTDITMTNGRIDSVRIGASWVQVGTVIIAGGSWSPNIGRLFKLNIPIVPAKGQMLAVRADMIGHVIHSGDHYLVPRSNGEVIIGSTVEFEGYTKDVTLSGIHALIDRARSMVPELAKAPLSNFWAGLRPYPTTGRPLLGWAPRFENLVLATGHHRNGIVLAPITGRLIHELITTNTTSIDLAPFAVPDTQTTGDDFTDATS